MLTAAEIVDQAISDRVVVTGSLPPTGHDLDLVARPQQCEEIIAALLRHGYVRAGTRLACFDEGAAEVVDLVDVSRWRLPEGPSRRLFDDAEALLLFRRLCVPAAHHQLLIAARRATRERHPLSSAVATRASAARSALPAAQAISADWNARRSLRLLVRSLDGRRPMAWQRWLALADEPAMTPTASLRRLRPRRRAAVVVAFSGLDGAGKTTQIEALARRLSLIGIPSARVWTRLSFNPRLWQLGRGIKALLPVQYDSGARMADVDDSRLNDPGRRLRASSRTVTSIWASIVAMENGHACGGKVREAQRSGRVALADRYHLDSAVHLRYRYGERSHFGLQRLLISVLSPAATVTFYLRMPPEEAVRRKPDQFTVAQLCRQAKLYDAEAAAARAVVVDATQPAPTLSDVIARWTWLALQAGRDTPIRSERRPASIDLERQGVGSAA